MNNKLGVELGILNLGFKDNESTQEIWKKQQNRLKSILL